MAYQRVQTRDGVTIMNSELYDNLQDGIDELKSKQFEKIIGTKSTICNNSKSGGLLLRRIIGRTTQDANPSPESPKSFVYGGTGGVTYSILNNNIINFGNSSQTTEDGIVYSSSGKDGKYKVSGTPTETKTIIIKSIKNLPIGEYFLSGCPINNSEHMYMYAEVRYNNGTTNRYHDYGSGVIVPINEESTYCIIYLYIANGFEINTEFKPTFHLNAENYEFTIGTSQELTFPVTGSLRGIPVYNDSYATYIDKDNKMWCTDEINIDRGVTVKRTGNVIFSPIREILLDNGNVAAIQSISDKVQDSAGCICDMAVYDPTKSGIEGTFYEEGGSIIFVGNTSDTLDTLKTRYKNAQIIYVLKYYTEKAIDATKLIEAYGLLSYDDATFILNNDGNIDTIIEYPTTDCAGISGLSYNMVRRMNAQYSIMNATVG